MPLVAERGPGGGWRLLEGYRTSLTGMTTPEVQALFLAGVAGPLRELGLGKALDSVFLKLLATLPSIQRADAEQARRRLHVDAVPWYRSSEAIPHLPVLQDAVWQDCRLRLTYGRDEGHGVERVVEPYGLVVKGNVWYLVARADGQMRTYRAARIQAATLLAERFPRDDTFELAAYWSTSVAEFQAGVPRYPLLIRVSPAGLPALPRRLGRTDLATVELAGPRDADGWYMLALEFDTLEEARAGILQLGASVEVLEPEELRESIQAAIGELAALYRVPQVAAAIPIPNE
ncbi:MAG TPA: WYL domain-containing protein [Chloroflexota bacterium]